MLDFVSIFRFLGDLLKAKNERKERIFEKLIQPAHDELMAVHRDYIGAFSTLKTMLPRQGDSREEFLGKTSKALDYLFERSLQLEPVRDELYANRLLRDKELDGLDPDVRNFYSAVVAYIRYGDPLSERENLNLEHHRRRKHGTNWRMKCVGTRFGSMIDTLSEDPADALRFCDELMDDAREKWINVCENYTKVRLKAFSHS